MDGSGRKKYCCKFPGCNTWYYSPISEGVNKHFYHFPKDPQYQNLWRKICKIDSSKCVKYWLICEDHFGDIDFVNERKEKLKHHAVPLPPLKKPIGIGVVPLENLLGTSASSPHLQDSEVTSIIALQDHDYCKLTEY